MESNTNTDIPYVAGKSLAVSNINTTCRDGSNHNSPNSSNNHCQQERLDSSHRRSGRVAKRPGWLAEMITVSSTGARRQNREESHMGDHQLSAGGSARQRRRPPVDGNGKKGKERKQRVEVGDSKEGEKLTGKRPKVIISERDQKLAEERRNISISKGDSIMMGKRQKAAEGEEDQERTGRRWRVTVNEFDQKTTRKKRKAPASEEEQKVAGKRRTVSSNVGNQKMAERRQNVSAQGGNKKRTEKNRNAIANEESQNTTERKQKNISGHEDSRERRRRKQKTAPVPQGSPRSADQTSSERCNQLLNGHEISSTAKKQKPETENSLGANSLRKDSAVQLKNEITVANRRSAKRESSAGKSYSTTLGKHSPTNTSAGCTNNKQSSGRQRKRPLPLAEDQRVGQGRQRQGKCRKTDSCSRVLSSRPNSLGHKGHPAEPETVEQDSNAICDADSDGDGDGDNHTAESKILEPGVGDGDNNYTAEPKPQELGDDAVHHATVAADGGVGDDDHDGIDNKKLPGKSVSAGSNRSGAGKCRVCGKVFRCSSVLKIHILTHYDEALPSNEDSQAQGDENDMDYMCCVCGKTFSTEAQLLKHQSVHERKKGKRGRGSGPKTCSVCNKVCVNIHTLRKHELVHTGEKPFTCKVCGKAFSQVGNLKIHNRIHTGEKPFNCDTCGRAFARAGDLKKHRLTHSDVKSYVCDVCSKAFATSDYLSSHKEIHSDHKPYKCDECDRAFRKPAALKVHKVCHSGVKQFRCQVCSKAFTTRGNLKEHQTTHTGHRPFKCNVCSKTFTKAFPLRKHMMLHTGIRPFPCDLCSKGYATRSELEIHKRTHTGDRPYKCEFCPADFFRKANLQQHVNAVHQRIKPFVCDLCGKAFSENRSLVEHRRIHSGVKPFMCEMCGKAFTQASTLKNHERTHTGEKPYSCKHCGKTFSGINSRNRHLRTHTGEAPYKCQQCPADFSRLETLKAHIRNWHPGGASTTGSERAAKDPAVIDHSYDAPANFGPSTAPSSADSRDPVGTEASSSNATPIQGACLQALSAATQSMVVPLLITVEDDGKIVYQTTVRSHRSVSAAAGVQSPSPNDTLLIIVAEELTSDRSGMATAREQADSAPRACTDSSLPAKLEADSSNSATFVLPGNDGPRVIPIIFEPQNGGTVNISAVIDTLVAASNDTMVEAAPELDMKFSSLGSSQEVGYVSTSETSGEILVPVVSSQADGIQGDGHADVLAVSSSGQCILESAMVKVVTEDKVMASSESAVTGGLVTTDSVVTDGAMAVGSAVTDCAVTGSVVTTDSAVIDSVVTVSSVVGDGAMTIDSPVIDSSMTVDSTVTENIMTADSVMIGNTATIYSVVSDSPVTTDSSVTNNSVTPSTAVIKSEIEDHKYSGTDYSEFENGCELVPRTREAQMSDRQAVEYLKSEIGLGEMVQAVASGNNEVFRASAVQLPLKQEMEITADSGKDTNKASAPPDLEYSVLCGESDHAQLKTELSPVVHNCEVSLSTVEEVSFDLGAEDKDPVEPNLGTPSQLSPLGMPSQHTILRDLLTESSSPSLKMKQAAQAGLKLSTLRSKGMVSILVRKRKYGAVPKRWICEVCGHGFTQAASLKNHIAIQHSSGKTVRCDVCGKPCRSRSELAAHRRSHTGDRPFLCHLCHKTYKHNGDLQQHVLASHLGAKPHTCEECGKAFTEKRSLKEHQLIHRGLKPHTCCTCGKAFTQLGTLRKHQLTHVGGESEQTVADAQDKHTPVGAGIGENPYEAGDILSGTCRKLQDKQTIDFGSNPQDKHTGTGSNASRCEMPEEESQPSSLHRMLLQAGEEGCPASGRWPAESGDQDGLRQRKVEEQLTDALEDLAAVASLALASR